jgi:poly-beta-1,6-N-acetyl-D-glucosamine N-deacetylase
MARVLLALVLAGALVVPTVSYEYARHLVLLGARDTVAPALPIGADLKSFQAFALNAPATFVVLGYVDLSLHAEPATRSASRTIAASSFAGQLAMLRAAGFSSITADQLQDYLSGGTRLPRHAVLIAFDGGHERDWTLADDLLARYGFSAVVFIDPGQIAGRGSGYLSWTQLTAMTASRRWSVGLDFEDAGQSVAIDANGTRGPALLEPAWQQALGRAETSAQYTARIRRGLQGEIDTVVGHGLARPELVAYPFGPGYPLNRVAANFDELTEAVNSTVSAGVLGLDPDTGVTAAYQRERLLPAIEIYNGTSADGLFDRIEAASS